MADRKRPAELAAEQPDVGEGMSHREIEDAGLMVDLPYEAPPGRPPEYKRADLGEGKRWTPPDGFTIAGVPYDEIVVGQQQQDEQEGSGGTGEEA